MKLSIVIPCYNEAKNIPVLLNKLDFIRTHQDIEIILVDNGSTDQTSTILQQLLSRYSFARTVKIAVNQGYGLGILQGLKIAQGQFLGWTHADLQTDPHDILKAYDLIVQEGECPQLYIKGNRVGRPWFDQFFTVGMSCFETIYLKKILWDINAQPTIFHKNFFAQWQNPPHDFSLDLYALYLAKKQGLTLIRFDVKFPERVHGQSSWNTGLGSKLKLIKRTIQFSSSLKKSDLL